MKKALCFIYLLQLTVSGLWCQEYFLYDQFIYHENWTEENYAWIQLNRDSTFEYQDFKFPLIWVHNDSSICIGLKGKWKLSSDTIIFKFDNSDINMYMYSSSQMTSLYDYDWITGEGDQRVFETCIETLGRPKSKFESISADSLNKFIDRQNDSGYKRKKYCR